MQAYGNRRHINTSVKETMVVMSAYLKPSNIAQILAVSPRTVQRVLLLSRHTGSVVRRPLRCGRNRALNGLDVVVCLSFLMASIVTDTFTVPRESCGPYT
jgi:hypothetical protein